MQHIIKYIQVYPADYADPERLAEDPDYKPGEFGPVEDYEITLSHTAPMVGDVLEGWIVAQVDAYHPQNTEAQFHTAICTLDGSVPDRHDWASPGVKVLTLFLDGDDVSRNPDGSAVFAVSDKLNYSAKMAFKPEHGQRPIAGYDLVIAA